MATVDKLGTYISQLMATVIESDDDFVKELALTELRRLKVNIDEFLVKHLQIDDVSKDKVEKQLLQEDKENVKDK
tara:strand:- start:330 stop:554 length:225 start_codon:yes stop_codon:yes gene_type:complete